MVLEEFLKLKKGDRVKCSFTTSRIGKMVKNCTVSRIFPNREKPFALVEIDNNILGNMFVVNYENVIEKIC